MKIVGAPTSRILSCRRGGVDRRSKVCSTTKALCRSKWLLAVSAVLLAGVGYRVAAYHLKLAIDKPIVLPLPLSAFPAEIYGWKGKDVPVPKLIQQTAGNDDYLYRFFIHKSTGQWAKVYIAYSSHPRTMLGHRPEVCYVADGWVHESVSPSQFLSSEDRPIECSIHHFHKSGPSYEEIVVLNFYVLNGRITRSESGFSGLGWRTPNLKGNPASYVAQVQVSSVLENSVQAAAEDMTESILAFLPDENGKVGAAEYADVRGGISK